MKRTYCFIHPAAKIWRLPAVCDKNRFFWLIADKEDAPGRLYAYGVSTNGITSNPPVPVISLLSGITEIRHIKFSPAGNKIAFTGKHQDKGEVVGVVDFNINTGQISNVQTFSGYTNFIFRGVEFSPNGKVLYTTDLITPIYQYNLSAGNETQIEGLKKNIVVNAEIYAPQLASDGKIYISQSLDSTTNKYLAVIEEPNLIGRLAGLKKMPFTWRAGDFYIIA